MDSEPERREIQRLYLEVLAEPPDTSCPLDFETVIGYVFPTFKGVTIASCHRKRARRWIDELLDLGILVCAPLANRKEHDVFIINPAREPDPIKLLKDVPPSRDLGRAWRILTGVLALADLALLTVFAMLFMPRHAVAQLSGIVALGSLVFGLVGLRLREAHSLSELLWTQATLRAAVGLSGVASAALIWGALTPVRVTVVPGATILVDGQAYTTAPVMGAEDMHDVTVDLYLPWGRHTVAVEKQWYQDPQTGRRSPSKQVSWLTSKDRTAVLPLVASVSFTQSGSTVGRTQGGSLGAGSASDSAAQAQGLVFAVQESLLDLGGRDTFVHRGESPSEEQLPYLRVSSGQGYALASLDVLWDVGYDQYSTKRYLSVSFRAKSGEVARTFHTPLGGSRMANTREAQRLGRQVLEQLGIELSAPRNEAWKSKVAKFSGEAWDQRPRFLEVMYAATKGMSVAVQSSSLPSSDKHKLLYTSSSHCSKAVDILTETTLLRTRSPYFPGTMRLVEDLMSSMLKQGRVAIELELRDVTITISQSIGELALYAQEIGNQQVVQQAMDVRTVLTERLKTVGPTELLTKMAQADEELQDELGRREGRFTLIKGTFHVVGYSPDGDSIKFKANDDAQWEKLNGPRVRLNSRGHSQLHFEAVDALETHYNAAGTRTHQPLKLANAATDFTLAALGIVGVEWDPNHSRVTTAKENTQGYILTRATERYGRPISFIFGGTIKESDGETVSLDETVLRKSVNYKLIDAGLAYPVYYEGLLEDIRNLVTDAVLDAREHKRGVWTTDCTTQGVHIDGLETLQTVTIYPKLFRRLAVHLVERETVTGFRERLSENPERIHVLSRGHFTNLDTIIDVQGNRIKMTVPPEDLVFRG